MELELRQIWMIAGGARNLGSGYTALICGASELTYCGRPSVAVCAHNFHNVRRKGGAGWPLASPCVLKFDIFLLTFP